MCPPHTYNSAERGSHPRVCITCPEHSRTSTGGATDIGACSCNAGFQPTAQAGGGVSCICAAGHRLASVDGSQFCQQCPIQLYKPFAGNVKCTDCPLPSMVTFSTGSTSVADCICPKGDYMAAVAGNTSCAPCPEYAVCDEPGLRLEDMPLQPGSWRPHELSVAVRHCYRDGACQGGTHVSAPAGSNGSYCSLGYGGPYCDVCSAVSNLSNTRGPEGGEGGIAQLINPRGKGARIKPLLSDSCLHACHSIPIPPHPTPPHQHTSVVLLLLLLLQVCGPAYVVASDKRCVPCEGETAFLMTPALVLLALLLLAALLSCRRCCSARQVKAEQQVVVVSCW